MMRALLWIMLAAAPALFAERFLPDDPLLQEPPPLDAKGVRARKLNDQYDFLLNTFGHPGRERAHVPAQGVNTLGEPMEGAWYTRRHFYRPTSLEELKLGPDGRTPPDTDGPWTVIRAKAEGITPGFTVVDSKKQVYFLKFDPVTNPEMATAADVIGSRFFYALGYHVPDNYVVYFDEKQLALGEDVSLADRYGRKHKMTRRDLLEILLKTPRDSQGRYRAVASRAVPGKPVGPFRYHGQRHDDPNDIVPHQDRRDLRGLRVFCAWLNHEDSRAVNTLDTLVDVNGVTALRHYLIDFGSTLGSASTKANPPRSGHEYLFQWSRAAQHLFTLGLAVPDWARAKYPRMPSVGRFEAEKFKPGEWVPEYRNPAFENCAPDDAYWAARQVMHFRDDEIRAIVETGGLTDRKAADYLAQVIIDRRDRVGRAYLEHVLPLDRFEVRDGRLVFEDLGLKHGLVKERSLTVAWARFENATGVRKAAKDVNGFTLPAGGNGGAPAWWAAEIRQQGDERRSVTVYLRAGGAAFRVVGVDRTW